MSSISPQIVRQGVRSAPYCKKCLKDHLQAIKSLHANISCSNVSYVTLIRENRMMWHQISQALMLHGDVQALPCHLKEDDHHPGFRSSDSHQTVSRLAWGHPRSTRHFINIYNAKHHGLIALASRGPLGCQASCEVLK